MPEPAPVMTQTLLWSRMEVVESRVLPSIEPQLSLELAFHDER